MFGSLGPMELIIIGAIVLLIFGPKKIPQLGKGIGETIREFRKAGKELSSLHDDDAA